MFTCGCENLAGIGVFWQKIAVSFLPVVRRSLELQRKHRRVCRGRAASQRHSHRQIFSSNATRRVLFSSFHFNNLGWKIYFLTANWSEIDASYWNFCCESPSICLKKQTGSEIVNSSCEERKWEKESFRNWTAPHFQAKKVKFFLSLHRLVRRR